MPCPTCHKTIPPRAAFCPRCGSALASVGPLATGAERVYFASGRIKVTDARLVVNETTWAMQTVSSYKIQTAVSRRTTQGGTLIVIGLVALILGIPSGHGGSLFGALFILVGIIVAYRSNELYELHLVAGGTNVVALRSFDLPLVKRVVGAIDQALGTRR